MGLLLGHNIIRAIVAHDDARLQPNFCQKIFRHRCDE